MSSECLCLLLEKEEEKKRVAQEKERHKLERELKKKQKEEEQKRKAEEKVRKANEREAAKALKEAAKADREAAKLAEREKKELQKSRESGQKRQTCPAATTTRPKQNKLKENVDDSINADLCCVCFGSYQEWMWALVAPRQHISQPARLIGCPPPTIQLFHHSTIPPFHYSIPPFHVTLNLDTLNIHSSSITHQLKFAVPTDMHYFRLSIVIAILLYLCIL